MQARLTFAALVLALVCAPAQAQNNFPTPGGARADGRVIMCVDSNGVAAPCVAGSGQDTQGSSFPTPGGARVDGMVRMCLDANGFAVTTCGGGGTPTPALAASGPSSGTVNVASSNFTVSLSNATFNGAQTVTIADGAQGGTLTPSVGAPGTSSVVVTPVNGATSFTFTYTPVSTGAKTLTINNAQGWTNPAPLAYTSNAAGGTQSALVLGVP